MLRYVLSDAKGQKSDLPLTVISEGDILTGSLEMSGSGRVMGSLEGERLTCAGDLLVGPNARVHANVAARSLTIAGAVRGDVVARGRLEITKTGRLEGDAVVESLSVQEGGVHYGLLQVYPDGLPEAPPELAPAPVAAKARASLRRLWAELF
jgi:cytoskeletal protein CcmA (bactofilin family)